MTHEETERILNSLRRHYPSTKVYNTQESIEAYRARQFRSNPCETFIKALLSWDEAAKDRQTN